MLIATNSILIKRNKRLLSSACLGRGSEGVDGCYVFVLCSSGIERFASLSISGCKEQDIASFLLLRCLTGASTAYPKGGFASGLCIITLAGVIHCLGFGGCPRAGELWCPRRLLVFCTISLWKTGAYPIGLSTTRIRRRFRTGRRSLEPLGS